MKYFVAMTYIRVFYLLGYLLFFEKNISIKKNVIQDKGFLMVYVGNLIRIAIEISLKSSVYFNF